jgi:hypothetical protein
MAMAAWTLRWVAKALKADGFAVHNLDYASRTVPLEDLGGTWLPAELRKLGLAEAPRVHFVTHSMGGIVLRVYQKAAAPKNLGNVVMLGPPNGGSEVIDGLRSFPIAFKIVGINAPRIGTGAGSVPVNLGPWPRSAGRLGIIAGDSPINPLFNGWLPKPHDGEVAVANAKLEGMAELHVGPYSHNGMLLNKKAIDLTRRFIRTGSFGETAPAGSPP